MALTAPRLLTDGRTEVREGPHGFEFSDCTVACWPKVSKTYGQNSTREKYITNKKSGLYIDLTLGLLSEAVQNGFSSVENGFLYAVP